MSSNSKFIVIGISAIVIIAITLATARYNYIESSELGVMETFTSGVQPEPLQPGGRILVPAFMKKVLAYDLRPNVFVMNNKAPRNEPGSGRDRDAYVAKSSDNQAVTISMNTQWRYDPTKIIEIHSSLRTHTGVRDWQTEVEEKVIRPVLMRVVNTEATKRTAIEAYSGQTFVDMQNDIAATLMDKTSELAERGIIIDNFVIEGVELDSAYIGEINQRQVAQQRTLRAQEEEKAANAEAKRAEAEARADYNRQAGRTVTLCTPNWATDEDKEGAMLRAGQGLDSDDVEFDDHALVSLADNGLWVQGWIWVPSEDAGDEDESEVEDRNRPN